jgi:hypothetical protein
MSICEQARVLDCCLPHSRVCPCCSTLWALCCAFVEWGWFVEVTINRLPVGHTHQIVDQLFHAGRHRLCRQSVTCLEELVTALHQAYPLLKPNIVLLSEVASAHR